MDWTIASDIFALRYADGELQGDIDLLDQFMEQKANRIQLPTPHSYMRYAEDDPRAAYFAAHMYIRDIGDIPVITGEPPKEPNFSEISPKDAKF